MTHEIQTFCGDEITLVIDPKQKLVHITVHENEGEHNTVTISLASAELLELMSALLKSTRAIA